MDCREFQEHDYPFDTGEYESVFYRINVALGELNKLRNGVAANVTIEEINEELNALCAELDRLHDAAESGGVRNH